MPFERPPKWVHWPAHAQADAIDLRMTRSEMIQDLLALSGAPTAGRELPDDPYLRSEELAWILLRLGGPRGVLEDVDEADGKGTGPHSHSET